MRAVRLFVATSLDGYIAREDGRVDWLFTDGDFGMGEFLKSVDTVLIGRRTYGHLIKMGMHKRGNPVYPGMVNYVFSRTLEPGDRDGMTFIADHPKAVVESLRQRDGRHIWLVGGGGLVQSLLAQDLVDEIIMGVHPVLLGAGIPLFPGGHGQLDLTLAKCEAYANGMLMMSYRRADREPSNMTEN